MTATTGESDAFVFFGATGDLAYRQIFPALQALVRRGLGGIPTERPDLVRFARPNPVS